MENTPSHEADDRRPVNQADVTAILASIGAQIRMARQRKEWFLSDLADLVGVSTSVVCRIELARREPSFHQLVMVCAALERRLSDVIRIAEDEAYPLGLAPWTPRPYWQS